MNSLEAAEQSLKRLREEIGRVVVGQDPLIDGLLIGLLAGGHVLVPTSNGLVRFSTQREGSFEGRDPWPRRVEPGNLLPLERVLLVGTRSVLQAFYSWSEIERDVARRRRVTSASLCCCTSWVPAAMASLYAPRP